MATLEMRVTTKERRVGVELADEIPNYGGHSGKFILKLIVAWIAMGFRKPEITWGTTVSTRPIVSVGGEIPRPLLAHRNISLRCNELASRQSRLS